METVWEILLKRRSVKPLFAPAPKPEALEKMLQAATQVPDHGGLVPFRFVVIAGEAALARLRLILLAAAEEAELGEAGRAKAERVAGLAPMVIAVVSQTKIGRIPVWEQQLSAGCAVYAMQLAAKAQGFDSIWLTGQWVETQALRVASECAENEQIIALLMVGTAGEEGVQMMAKNEDLTELVSYW